MGLLRFVLLEKKNFISRRKGVLTIWQQRMINIEDNCVCVCCVLCVCVCVCVCVCTFFHKAITFIEFK